MDIELDDIFAVHAAKPALAAGKFRPNAKRPVLRKGVCAPANAKQGTSKSLDSAAAVNNAQNVAEPNARVHEGDLSQSSNSKEIDRQESTLKSEGPPLLSNMSLDMEKDLEIPIQDPLKSSSFGVTDDIQSETFPGFTVVQESVTVEEDAPLIGGDSQIDKLTIETDVEAEDFPGLASIESFPDSIATSSIEKHRGKFIPKKMKGGSKKPDSGIQHSEAKKDHLPDISVGFKADVANEGPTPSSVPGDVFDYSAVMLDESTPGDQVSQPPEGETLEDCSGPSQSDASILREAEAGVDAGVLSNTNCKKAKRVQDSLQKPVKSSNGSADNEVTKSSRPRKKRGATLHHGGESDDKAHNDTAQNTDGIAGEADVDANGEETLSQMKKSLRKSKTTRTKSAKQTKKKRKNGDDTVPEQTSEEQEPPKTTRPKSAKQTKKRKNGDDTVPEQASEEQEPLKKKKFAHSTQRRKRCVDKVLLETPEEDIDYQKLRMRDLILLAEHKEKLAKKAKMPKTSSGSASTQKSVDGDDSRNNEATVTPEENEALDQETDNVEPIITLFNYQSFMNKTPTAKWSKQDTELFYEGIRQFGTDLGMIKELFPDLTRHQIKLKYKKEERQNPLRLSEAIYGRAKDHRHFELVIKRLEAANKAETESNADDSAAVTGDGDGDDEGGEESNGQANNEEDHEAASMPEKEEKKETKDEEDDHGNFETRQNQQGDDEGEEDEIDEDFFNSYKSEF